MSEALKAAQKKYQQSAKGRARARKYKQSEHGQAVQRECKKRFDSKTVEPTV